MILCGLKPTSLANKSLKSTMVLITFPLKYQFIYLFIYLFCSLQFFTLISFPSSQTCKISTLLEVNDCKDPEGLKTLYYLAQDLKTLVFDLISLHFKIKPYNV